MTSSPLGLECKGFPLATRLTICSVHDLPLVTHRHPSHVIGILDPDYSKPKVPRSTSSLDLRFHDVINQQQGLRPPAPFDIQRLLEFGSRLPDPKSQPTHLVVYCHAGISRSTAAVILLLAQAQKEQSANSFVARVCQIQPMALPNRLMVEIGDDLLKLKGQLISAVNKLYADIEGRF
ncbi:tyrosine phosphatase family protein [Bradyrhizobium tunisiense]|uniref:tyrosine phosphatase family protein n=1 Tax=Bradyrhizobium tunisiense TaxID=3278709 RepID=UPI0035D78E42